MTASILESTLDKFTTFGDLLRYLRRRAGITQTDLSIAVGYSISQISRLEQNLRPPDIPTIQARFIQPLCLEDEPKTVARLLELAATIRREDAPGLGLCPYKGLDYFDEGDAELFVGREVLTEKLVENVFRLSSNDQNEAGRFFAIVGASGSGKSSLVRAGMVPAIRWNKTASNWLIYVFTPTAHPLESLATSLTRESPLTATAQLIDDLAGEPRALGLYINRALKVNSGTYFLLVIDQFEELFALCRSKVERSAFIDNLLMAAEDADGKAIIVITLRADFYSHCASYLQLRQALARHQEYIGVMSDEEMRRAIEEPARRGRWEFEPGLVDLILQDVGHEPGALPLLSHALLETWQRRQGRTMTLSGYISSGGVRGAIAETAETVFTDQFNHEQQAIARRIFLRLTELGDETATGDTRRRATINELIMKPEESDATQVVLKALADARLVTTSEDSVQVAHEALIREWPTLRGWLEDNREGLRLHRQLTEASQEWSAAERDPGILFRGARLGQAREWADLHKVDINELEIEFLEESIASSDREAAEREAQHQRELEAAQKLAESESRSSKKLHKRAIYLSLALLVTFILVVVSVIFARQADLNSQLAQRGQEKADTASTIAINESYAHSTAEAVAVNQRSTAEAAKLQAINQADIRATAEARAEGEARVNLSLSLASAAQQANQSGQGDLALALALESVKLEQPPSQALKSLRDVSLGTGTRAVLAGYKFPARAVAISPDAQTAISGGCAQEDSQGVCLAGELILWDLVTLREINRWSAHHGMVNKVTYSSDGQYLISSGLDGSLIVWNNKGVKIQQPVDLPAQITGLAVLSNSDEVLLGFDDGSLFLWNITTDKKKDFWTSSSPITALAVASETTRAVTAHQDGSLALWDLNTGQRLRSFPDQGFDIRSIVISPDGKQIIFGSTLPPRIYIHVIDSQAGSLLREKSLGCMPYDLVLSSDAAYLLVGCYMEVMLIDLPNWSVQHEFTELTGTINGVSISQDGNLGMTALNDGSLRILNLGKQESYKMLDLEVGELFAIAASPDAKYLVLSDTAPDIFSQPGLWDIEQNKVVMTYSLPISVVLPGAIQISPDNRYAAAAGTWSNSPAVLLWDLKSGRLQCPPFEGYTVNGRAVAFSPDSRYLLAGSQLFTGSTGELYLWNVRSCELVRKFNNTEDVTSIAFSSDGSLAITGIGFKGRVTLWDVATGEAIGRYPYMDGMPVLGVAFGPDNKTILGTGLFDLYLWDVDSKAIIRRYTGLTIYPYNLALSADYKYVLAGTMNGELILWDFATGREVDRLNTNLAIMSVAFSPDGKIAFAGTSQGVLIKWQLAEKTLPELLDWISVNRYVRPLTDTEKLQFHIKP